MNDRVKVINNIKEYREIEILLRHYLIGKSIDRKSPLAENVENELYTHEIPPFFTKKGARLDAVAAVSLVNRYCNQLPSDRFSKPCIIWTVRETKPKSLRDKPCFTVTCQLPIQSKIKNDISVSILFYF